MHPATRSGSGDILEHFPENGRGLFEENATNSIKLERFAILLNREAGVDA